MRRAGAVGGVVAALAGCGRTQADKASASAALGPSASAATGDVDRAALVGLDGTLPEARAAASGLVAASPATKAEAAKILIRQIDFTTSDAWRTKHQPEVVEANHNARIDTTDAQLDSEMRGFQDEEVAGLVSLAPKIGGSALVAKCFEVAGAERPKAAAAARAALAAMKSSLTPAEAARLAALPAPTAPTAADEAKVGHVEVGISDVSITGGAVSNAQAVVAGMAAGFHRCYTRAQEKAALGEGDVTLTIRVDKTGAVTEALPSATNGTLGDAPACLAARAASAQFAAPKGGEATIVVKVQLHARP